MTCNFNAQKSIKLVCFCFYLLCIKRHLCSKRLQIYSLSAFLKLKFRLSFCVGCLNKSSEPNCLEWPRAINSFLLGWDYFGSFCIIDYDLLWL